MSNKPHREQYPTAYYDGRTARERKASKLACPYSPSTRLGSWWLAGWNETDITLEAKTPRPATEAPGTTPTAA